MAKNTVFDTLDIISDIDFCYWVLSLLAEDKELSFEEVRKRSMKGLKRIIRLKKKLGYDTTDDEQKHLQIKQLIKN